MKNQSWAKTIRFSAAIGISILGLLISKFRRRSEFNTVPNIDIDKYIGTWYEIARVPSFFERKCVNTTATYFRHNGGVIGVKNECVRNGKRSSVEGVAWFVDARKRSKLKVAFSQLQNFLPFLAGDYWILAIGPENERGQYSYAAVASPSAKIGWILSRSPHREDLGDSTLDLLFQLFERQGLPRTKFVLTEHMHQIPAAPLVEPIRTV